MHGATLFCHNCLCSGTVSKTLTVWESTPGHPTTGIKVGFNLVTNSIQLYLLAKQDFYAIHDSNFRTAASILDAAVNYTTVNNNYSQYFIAHVRLSQIQHRKVLGMSCLNRNAAICHDIYGLVLPRLPTSLIDYIKCSFTLITSGLKQQMPLGSSKGSTFSGNTTTAGALLPAGE